MQAFSIGSLSLITGGNATEGFILQTPIEGFETPPHRTNTFARPGRHGATVSSQFYDGRLIKLVGKVTGSSPADYEANRRALIEAVAITKDDNGYPLPIRISFTTLAGQSYYLDAFFDRPIMDMSSPVDCDFMVTALAANPFIYGTATISSGNISRPTGGGFTWPVIWPFVSAASTGGTVILTNSGSETSWPTVDSNGDGGIRLIGSLTNPVLSNLTTGKVIELDYTLASGDYITIDMERQLILLNGSSTLISTKTTTSDWWGLAPGPNSISLSTSSASDGGYVTVTFNPASVGV